MERRIVLLCILLTLGCHSQPTVVGHWHSTITANGIAMDNQLEVRPDHTYTGIVTSHGVGFIEQGTWDTRGDQYHWTSKSIDPTGPIPDSRRDRVEPAMRRLRQLFGKPKTSLFRFEGDDILVVTNDPGGVNRLTRVK